MNSFQYGKVQGGSRVHLFKMKLFVFFCVLVAKIMAVPELPQPCHTSDPNIQSCFLDVVNKLKEFIPTGIPEYKIPSLDPFEVDLIRVSEEPSELLAVDVIIRNAKLTGLSQINIDNVKVDTEKLLFEMDATFPHAHATMNFKFSGKIGGSPLELQGFLSGNITDTKLNLALQFDKINRKGTEYGIVKTFKPKIFIGHMNVEVITKNPQDQPLANFVTQAFNNNDRHVLDLFNSIYTEAIADPIRNWLEESITEIPLKRAFVE